MALTEAPKFYSIESVNYPGYFLTQQGTQVILNAKNPQNPLQLWYIDESWRFLVNKDTHLPSFVFINHGSKKALKSQLLAASSRVAKVTVATYDPAAEDDSILWSYATDCKDQVLITTFANVNLVLGHGSSNETFKDGLPVISFSLSNGVKTFWRIVPYEPATTYKIYCHWGTQYLTFKQKLVDVSFTYATTHNDENNVVAVHESNSKLEGMVWYKVPAGGRDDTTFGSSFIVVNKSTGFALKGSTKPGDKVILTQYDPLDYDFVWSENRLQSAALPASVVINLDGTKLQWCLPLDSEYQNGPWYHPLTLVPATQNNAYLDRQAWKFIAIASASAS